MKYLSTKEHKDWSRAIRDRDDGCVICGEKKTAAHHLIPKEIIKFRTHMMNGIALCFKHHTKYGFGLSPHSHGSILFYLWMHKNRHYQLKWVEDNYEV